MKARHSGFSFGKQDQCGKPAQGQVPLCLRGSEVRIAATVIGAPEKPTSTNAQMDAVRRRSESKAEIPMSITVILAVSNEPGLLESRSSILRSDGYDVEPVLSVKQAIDLLGNSDFDLVLLGHSIPAQDRNRLARLIRASGLLTAVVTVTPLTAMSRTHSPMPPSRARPKSSSAASGKSYSKLARMVTGAESQPHFKPLQTTPWKTQPIPRVVQAPDAALPLTATGAPNLSPLLADRDQGRPPRNRTRPTLTR